MTLQSMTDEELGQARLKRVLEITELNQQIGAAKSSVHETERHKLERTHDSAMESLRVIDAEFATRGLDPKNA